MLFSDVVDSLKLQVNCSDIPSTLQFLSNLTNDELRKIHVIFIEALPKPTKRKGSSYSFVSNSEGSGLPFPCASLECCNSAIRFTGSFASMYADEVVLFNPFSTIMQPARMAGLHKRHFIRSIAANLFNVMSVYPAIKAGFVTFEDFDNFRLCADCFSRGLNQNLSFDNQKGNMLFSSANYFLENTTAKIYSHNRSTVSVIFSGLSEFSGHDEIIYTYNDNKGILKGKPVGYELDHATLSRIDAVQSPATFLVNDIASVADISERHNAKNILSSGTHISVLKSYLGKDFVKSGPNAQYPLTIDSDLEDTISFRKQEWHHLNDFRKFVSDGINSNQDVTAALNSESEKIEKIIAKNKRAFQTKMKKEVAVLAGAFSTAIVSSGFSSIASAMVGLLGAGHFAKNIAPLIVDATTEPEEIRSSSVYYAWKIRKAGTSH